MKRKQIAILVAIFILLIIFIVGRIRPYYVLMTQSAGINPVQTLFNRPQPDQKDGVTNILLLGIPDEDNDGPNLTDSMMVFSFDSSTNTLTTVGLPRDIWSPTLRDKINTAYAYGEARKEGGGMDLAKKEISALIGHPIHYAAVVRFSTFASIIDALGGIEVVVERSFTDNEYPIKGKENDECFGMEDYSCRYKTVSFTAGKTHMTGERALEFVRSRHAEGVEGSDFARSKRQQQVISALQQKMMIVMKKGELKEMQALYNKIDAQIKRDITNQEAAVLVKKTALSSRFTVQNVQISESLFEVPENKDYDGKYVLVPANQTEFDTYISCILKKTEVSICSGLKE